MGVAKHHSSFISGDNPEEVKKFLLTVIRNLTYQQRVNEAPQNMCTLYVHIIGFLRVLL